MKYTVYFNQKSIWEYWKSKGVKLDTVDWTIINWIVDFSNAPWIQTKIIDWKIYFWFAYQKIIDDLPMIYINSKDVIARRLNKYIKCWLLEKNISKEEWNKTYFYCTKKIYDLFKLEKNNNSKIETYQLKNGKGSDLKKDRVSTKKSDNYTIKDYTIKNKNNIIINNNTENKVFWEEEKKVDKKNILEKPLLKNDSLLKKLEEGKKEKKVPQKKEKKEYWNREVNNILKIIKQNNDWIIAWTEKEKRQYAWLLFNKLKKYVNWDYDIFTTLDILLKKMKVSKYYATRITGPKKIYYKLEEIIAIVKTEKNSKIRKF